MPRNPYEPPREESREAEPPAEPWDDDAMENIGLRFAGSACGMINTVAIGLLIAPIIVKLLSLLRV